MPSEDRKADRKARSRSRHKEKDGKDGKERSSKGPIGVDYYDDFEGSSKDRKGKPSKDSKAKGKPDPVRGETVKGDKVKSEKSEVGAVCIDIDLDDDDEPVVAPVKAEVKGEIKSRETIKKEKQQKRMAKVKKEQNKDVLNLSPSPARKRDKDKPKDKAKEKDKKRKRSKSRSPSSSSSSSSSSSDSDMYRKFKPYTKVTLVNLQRKAEMNGMKAQVVHPSMAVSPCPPGCILVRLESGREIAIKTANLALEKSFRKGPPQAHKTERLQQVLKNIKNNVDSGTDRTACLSVTDDSNTIQGGMGHII